MIATIRTRLWGGAKWVAVSTISAFIGAVIGFYINAWMSQDAEEETIARWAVASMLERCPVKDYDELVTRKDSFLLALRRAKNDARGRPVWRQDCTIGAHYAVNLGDSLRLDEWLRREKRP